MVSLPELTQPSSSPLSTLDPDETVYIQVISRTGLVIVRVGFQDIKTLFQRALNTWPEADRALFEFSDQLDKM